MTLDGLITHGCGLEEINEALDLFRSGEVGRIVLNMLGLNLNQARVRL